MCDVCDGCDVGDVYDVGDRLVGDGLGTGVQIEARALAE